MELKTADGLKISATYYKSASNSKRGVILLHMLARNRGDWENFARKIQPFFDVVAIDFRGHGDSEGDFTEFGPDDFKKFPLDAKAAADFLGKEGVRTFAIIGGSIGANTALIVGAQLDADRVAALSPGLDYKGVRPEEAARSFMGGVFFAASEDDPYSANSTRRLFEMSLAKKQMKIFQNAGHGTRMFASTDLDSLLLNWLRE